MLYDNFKVVFLDLKCIFNRGVQLMKNRSMNLDNIIMAFKKKAWLIICLTILGGIISIFAAQKVLKPTYSSTSRIIVLQNNKNSSEKNNVDLNDSALITTYMDMVTDPSIVRPVLNTIKRTQSYTGSLETLMNSISTDNTENSQIFSITVTDTDPKRAAITANNLTSVFQARADAITSDVKTEVLSKARPAASVSSPKKWIIVFAGILVGLLIGVFIALISAPVETNVSSSNSKSK
ncbi:hypothetical protein FC84_GL000759 [Lapidilactobacillus dextrinicus DSM 20335]|uniref:Capsular polysaccharide biosynthesis protein CpsC n=2 Tax=Lapidilactobacillus dextrinicus TaxID=51664 RepID=A0A0R2BRG7_9LACO|nr:hypothetical protein FC84_GL000759 [Lapidilactobacillus dextrinicus DSM 20335]